MPEGAGSGILGVSWNGGFSWRSPDRRSIDERLWGAPAGLTAADVADQIGRDENYVRRIWRLFGFSDPEQRLVFFPGDVELVRVHSQGAELFDTEPVEHTTRAVGASARSIVEAIIALLPESFGDLSQLPADEAEGVESLAYFLLDQIIHALPAVLLHHASETLWFMSGTTGTYNVERTLAVAFCDLVGSTQMANESPEMTARAITDFETYAADAIAQRGGRLVKFVGDEVMFATTQVEDAHDIALEVLRWVGAHDHLSLARAGIAYGAVASRDGDLYGATVNLAARLAGHAEPDTIVTADATGDTTLVVKGFDAAIRVRATRRA